ncbi:hypothetical protein BKA82DRAFT_11250 [Pisolithus tinctorius]|uniref:CCHC-type domain-containing protein n=1 Tax=Pisolithus tinctorius Marx 270 TaxID=870435 RepID=A0A0C3NFR9_PISTI|nr:hypothetical protein BKA82DRAFT_11250 [Pisolithus tinctorius]KIN94620.1 hypothetical protein M404DRAFT_11250 [Pisolithus tinctorius Marx 270]
MQTLLQNRTPKVKVAQPDIYDGLNEKYNVFINQLKLNFATNASTFATDVIKVNYAMSYMKAGHTQQWVIGLCNKQHAGAACPELDSWENFTNALKEKLCVQKGDLEDSLQGWKDYARCIDHDICANSACVSFPAGGPRPSGNRTFPFQPRPMLSPATAIPAHQATAPITTCPTLGAGEPMDIDWTSRHQGGRGIMCYRCGQTGHIARNCSRTEVEHIHTLWTTWDEVTKHDVANAINQATMEGKEEMKELNEQLGF